MTTDELRGAAESAFDLARGRADALDVVPAGLAMIQAAVWKVGAEICERLDQVVDELQRGRP